MMLSMSSVALLGRDGLTLGAGPLAAGRGGAGGVSYPISAPVLILVEPVTNPPQFLIQFEDDVEDGDVLQYDLDGAGYVDGPTVTPSDVTESDLDLGLSSQADGDHTLVVRFKRGALLGEPSNTVEYEISAGDDPFSADSTLITADSTTHTADEVP